MSNAHALDTELKTYADNLPTLVADLGKFALVKDSKIEGTFDTYEDALKVGYGKFQMKPFLVKQIAPAERILSFSRDLQLASDNA